MGIGKEILRLLLAHPLREDRILYMVGYTWTWDLSDGNCTAALYRERLLRLFSSFGFELYSTNEPNVMMRPENLFMARIGERVPNHIRVRFKMVRYDLDRYL